MTFVVSQLENQLIYISADYNGCHLKVQIIAKNMVVISRALQNRAICGLILFCFALEPAVATWDQKKNKLILNNLQVLQQAHP